MVSMAYWAVSTKGSLSYFSWYLLDMGLLTSFRDAHCGKPASSRAGVGEGQREASWALGQGWRLAHLGLWATQGSL